MLSLISREFKSRINLKNILRFLGQENWFLYFDLLIAMPTFLKSEGNWLYPTGMGIAIVISRWLLSVTGSELPTAIYFCPITEKERRQYFRKALLLRTVVLFLLSLGILLPISCINSTDTGGGIVGVIFVCICILPLVIRSGVDLEGEREKKLVSSDSFGSILMLCGYLVIGALGGTTVNNGEITIGDAFSTATVVANLANTLWGKIMVLFMFALIVYYFYHYYPGIESYIVDYERVQAVQAEKENKYQNKRKKRNRA